MPGMGQISGVIPLTPSPRRGVPTHGIGTNVFVVAPNVTTTEWSQVQGIGVVANLAGPGLERELRVVAHNLALGYPFTPEFQERFFGALTGLMGSELAEKEREKLVALTGERGPSGKPLYLQGSVQLANGQIIRYRLPQLGTSLRPVQTIETDPAFLGADTGLSEADTPGPPVLGNENLVEPSPVTTARQLTQEEIKGINLSNDPKRLVEAEVISGQPTPGTRQQIQRLVPPLNESEATNLNPAREGVMRMPYQRLVPPVTATETRDDTF